MNLREPSIYFPSAWLMQLFGRPPSDFVGFTEAELQRIGELSETHLLREAVRIVLLDRK